MKFKFLPLMMALTCFAFMSCNSVLDKRIEGNGQQGHLEKNVGITDKVLLSGNYKLEMKQGNKKSIEISTDENLLSYITVEEKEGRLVIKVKEGTRLSPTDDIHIIITTDKLSELTVNGNVDVKSEGILSGADYLKLELIGSGNIGLGINTPSVNAHIAGTGDIHLTGETRDLNIMIDGQGDVNTKNLKAENVHVIINGTGDADVFAAVKLDVNIAGSGDVAYLGNPQVIKTIAGAGKVYQMQ